MILCSFIGTFIVFLFLLGLLVYAGLGAGVSIFVFLIAGASAFPSLKSTYRLYDTADNLKELLGVDGEASEETFEAGDSYLLHKAELNTELTDAEVLAGFGDHGEHNNSDR